MLKKDDKKVVSTMSKTRDGANIQKSLSSFDVLNKKSKGRVVAYSDKNNICLLKEAGTKEILHSAPKKIIIETTVYKL